MIQPVQSVISKGEKLALELAELLVEGKKTEAQEKLQKFAKENKMAFWETTAVANIATCMRDGRRWKKGA